MWLEFVLAGTKIAVFPYSVPIQLLLHKSPLLWHLRNGWKNSTETLH